MAKSMISIVGATRGRSSTAMQQCRPNAGAGCQLRHELTGLITATPSPSVRFSITPTVSPSCARPRFLCTASTRLDTPFEPEEVIDWAIEQGPLYEPGTAYGYNTVGHIVAGLVIEEVTGNPAHIELATGSSTRQAPQRSICPGKSHHPSRPSMATCKAI